MNIINKIKEIFRRSKTKALPEPKQKFKENKFKKGIHVKNQTKNLYLENALDQYFECYNEILDEGKNSTNTSYEALTKINAQPQGNIGENRAKENLLLNNIYNTGKYRVQTQMSEATPAYYHIKSQGYQMPDFRNMIRLYINCDNKNVAEIAQNLLRLNENPNFYLKIDTSDSLEQHKRSEKIVIYAQDSDVEYTLQLVQYLKSIRPDLFENSEKNNPFMPQIDGIAMARQPISSTFNNLDGTQSKISQSANRFISTSIIQSYMQVARRIAEVDPELNFLLTPENINNEMLYVRNYQYISHYYNEYFVNSMEYNMKYLSRINNFQIQGINYDEVPSERYQNENDYYHQ